MKPSLFLRRITLAIAFALTASLSAKPVALFLKNGGDPVVADTTNIGLDGSFIVSGDSEKPRTIARAEVKAYRMLSDREAAILEEHLAQKKNKDSSEKVSRPLVPGIVVNLASGSMLVSKVSILSDGSIEVEKDGSTLRYQAQEITKISFPTEVMDSYELEKRG